jgi:peptidoglycan hydrolase-like protein with peptidoglycan-binding domain
VSEPAVESGSNRAELEKQLGELLAQFKSLTGKDFSASPVIVLANRTDLTVRDLTTGMQGEDVKALQTILMAAGYEIPAGPTGFFASQTKTALAKYQAEKDIVPAVGYFGSITRAQMKTAGMTGLWW